MTGPRNRSNLPAQAAFLGIAFSLGAWLVVSRAEDRTIRAHLEARALERALAIDRQLAVDVSAVEALAAALDASKQLSRVQFRTITSYLLGQHLSLRALGWNPRVPAAERAAFEAGEDGVECTITERAPDGSLVRAGARPVYYVVKYIEPEAGNEAAVCFDVGSEPSRRAALEQAAATGELTFSAGVALVQDDASRLGFLAFRPLYGTGAERELMGFSVGVFQIADIVREAMTRFEDSNIAIRIDDVSEPGEATRLYESTVGQSQGPAAGEATGIRIRGPTLEQGARTWQLAFTLPPDEVNRLRTIFPRTTLMAGLFITLLSTVYLQVLLRRTRRIEELAADRAAEIERRKRVEAERQALDAKLQESQKLESLGVLAGGIAHDFNNLLTTVLGNADLALSQLSAESPARDEIQQVRLAATRAAELTRQMLIYTGQAHFTPQRVDLSLLVEEMVHLLRSAISKGAQLDCEFAQDLPPVEGDPAQIRQIVMNLITNASDALGDGTGAITVRTALREAGPETTAGTIAGPGDPPPLRGPCVVLEISDTGCGMDERTRARMFDPFFSTKFQGHGLGLAAALGIVRGHSGAIQVDSTEGVGTRFTVVFPVAQESNAAEAPPAEPREALREAAGTILVVDDEEPIRRLASRMISRTGLHVRTACDGPEAIEIFERHADRIVAVLLDMTMPRMSGAETFRAIRQVRPDVKVLFSSGYDREQSLGQLAGERGIGFLQKPYRAQELEDALQELLDAAS